jgi:carboxypeptidase Q
MCRVAFLLLVGVALAVGAPPVLPSTFGQDVASLEKAVARSPTSGWDRLALWVDSVGHRLSGSRELENGLDFALGLMRQENFANVNSEPAMIPRWTRGQESLVMVKPYAKTMGLLGLGTSIGGSVTAEVVVVKTFAELNATIATGKIVVFNQQCDWATKPDECYDETFMFRTTGASIASRFGAVASLIRSLTGMSLYTPHTGIQTYASNVKPIPTACITVEDVELLWRLQARGIPVTLSLSMEATNHAPVQSRNIIAEITGTQWPEQVVLIGGHTDR